MYLAATPIWEAWNSGGPFIGDMRPSGRVTVDPDWQLVLSSTNNHRGRGTWWRDDPGTLTEFALSTTWVVDSRKRQGDRSFQRIRNGEWTYWGESGTAGGPIPPPASGTTRAGMASYIKAYADAQSGATPLPTYDGTVDFPDIGHLSGAQQAAIGQLTQAGILNGFPDGYFKPDLVMTDAQIAAVLSRAQEHLWGSTAGGGRAVVELPNVETITWDKSIDTDAAECSITMSNIKMRGNFEAQADESEFGFPGYYTPTRGENMDSAARWANHYANEWAGILAPNVILRTYEGYGGQGMDVRSAMNAGHLRQTGTWMVDRITVSTDGKIQIEARDMSRLLLEQQLFPPIVPQGVYPLRYCRYIVLEPNETHPEGEKRSGNYKDYAEIVYDLLLWAGFLYDSFPVVAQPTYEGGPEPEPGTAGFAEVHGVLESTGAYADECLPDDLFDKRPIIDAITEIRGIVGYLFWIDEEGAAHFQSPNWFEPGNFDEDQTHVDFTPEIDERINMTSYSMTLSSENLRTQIIISSEAVPPVPPYGSSAETYKAYKDAISRATYFTPTEGQEQAHGMHLPAMWVNGAFTKESEQERLAELIAMHIYYRSRQSSVSMVGNPCISINDQVRIYERTTSESFIHYVRGVSSSIDNQTGRYSMQLTTHWLGDGGSWVGEAFGGSRFVAVN